MFDKATNEAIVKAAVISALGETFTTQVVSDIVNRILKTKVNKNGNDSYDNYGGGYPDTPLLDFLVDRGIKDIVQMAVRQYVETQSDDIVAAVHESISSNTGIADSITKFVTQQLSSGSIVINVDLKMPTLD